MISPQERGAEVPSEITLTLLGEEVGTLMALLSAFPTGEAPCMAGDNKCVGVNYENRSPICTDCADLIRVTNHITNLRQELNRQWQTATQ